MRSIALLLMLAAVAAPDPTHAEATPFRVGVLFPGGEEPGAHQLLAAMAERGYTEGRSIVFLKRAAEGRMADLPRLAQELVAARPDVIVASTEPAARALVAATREIPIVLVVIGDPVALELTRSMARPTANVTGFTTGHDMLALKRVQLMLELLPAARKLAVLWVRGNSQNQLILERARRAAVAQNVELLSLPIASEREIADALDKAEREGASGLIVAADPLTLNFRISIIDGCLFRNLPAMHSYLFEVRDGGLISYGTETVEDYARAADYVDRLLKGAKVSDLPFQEPAQIRLAINLRVARSIGLTVPMSLIVRADEVIE